MLCRHLKQNRANRLRRSLDFSQRTFRKYKRQVTLGKRSQQPARRFPELVVFTAT